MTLGRLLPHARGLKFESLHRSFLSRWESIGFYPIDALIRGWQKLPSRYKVSKEGLKMQRMLVKYSNDRQMKDLEGRKQRIKCQEAKTGVLQLSVTQHHYD
ncbi:hypothetical protein Tco_1063453 [Tanacetum coccineum]